MRYFLPLLLASLALMQSGCAAMWAGAGAAGAATAYEARHKHELDELEDARNSGRISERDYQTRKDAIEDSSAVY